MVIDPCRAEGEADAELLQHYQGNIDLMIVLEIVKPGTWLDHEDSNWAWDTGNILDRLCSEFFEANAILNLFNTAFSRPSNRHAGRLGQDSERIVQIRKDVERELSCGSQSASWGAIDFEAEVRLKRERWAQGRPPHEFEWLESFIHAEAFLFKLNAFEKLLAVLSRDSQVPTAIASNHQKLTDDFPHLTGVRNSLQHMEDRSRSLGAGRNPKPLALKPVQNNFTNDPVGQMLHLRSLNGTRIGSTMADGHYGEVDVSEDSLRKVQRVLTDVLNSFRWKGPQQHLPRL